MWICMAGKDREFLNSMFCEYLTFILKARCVSALDVAQDCVAQKAFDNKGNTRCML